MASKVGGNQGYSCVLCCAQAAHALQELNVGTVHLEQLAPPLR